MDLRPLYIFYSFSAGIDFGRQNLTSIDVRFWRLKSVPAPKGLIYTMCYSSVGLMLCQRRTRWANINMIKPTLDHRPMLAEEMSK